MFQSTFIEQLILNYITHMGDKPNLKREMIEYHLFRIF